MAQQINGGRMDGFVSAYTRQGRDGTTVMGHYDARDLPFDWAAAHRYVLFDEFFSAVPYGTATERSYWVSGAAPTAAGDRPTIFDRLQRAGVSWKFYVENYRPAENYRTPGATQPVRAPLLGLARFVDDPALASHIVDLDQYYRDLDAGTLPSVAYVASSGSSERSARAIPPGQKLIRSLATQLALSPYWDSSALLWSHDGSGGWYDHVAPPPAADGPRGLRVPAVLISAYAPAGHVDHRVLDSSSALRFIEDNWNLAPLGGRDTTSASLAAALDFSAAPRPPEVLAAPTERPAVRPVDPALVYGIYGGMLGGAALLVTGTALYTARRRSAGPSEPSPCRKGAGREPPCRPPSPGRPPRPARGPAAGPGRTGRPRPVPRRHPRPHHHAPPVTVHVRTVPAVPGVRLVFAGASLVTGADGTASYTGGRTADRASLQLLDTSVSTPDARYRFTRWAGQRDPDQAFRTRIDGLPLRADYTVTAGFTVQYPVTASFTDQHGTPLDPSLISSVRVKGSDNRTTGLSVSGTTWLDGIVPVFRDSRLLPVPVAYTLRSLVYDGVEVADAGQQGFQPRTDRHLTFTGAFHDLTVTAHDALFGSATGDRATVTGPNGRATTVTLGPDHTAVLTHLPRGLYTVDVKAPGGLTGPHDVRLSQAVTADVTVVSRADLLLLVGAGLLVVVVPVAIRLGLRRRARRTAAARRPEAGRAGSPRSRLSPCRRKRPYHRAGPSGRESGEASRASRPGAAAP
ncbi:hypothetical protein O1L60_05820 [Streptomyces diastatochromogenes]|nr:hypothetical protein [Streptomyces diastatochromogenes]